MPSSKKSRVVAAPCCGGAILQQPGRNPVRDCKT